MDISRIKDKSNPNNLEQETILWNQGFELIAGVDEAGRGPFAGPLVAGAAIMPKELKIEKLTDSKKIIKKYHKHFSEVVKEYALAYGIGVVEVEEFDEIGNVVVATRLAMKRAVEQLKLKPDYLLIDGREKVALDIPQHSIEKGDYQSHSISAGAILAKVYRDELMEQLDKEYDGKYNWSKNAGYLTKEHEEAIHKYGLTPLHRKSWVDVYDKFKKQP